MTDGMRLGHVLLPVADLEAALAFYRDVLGLTVKFQDGDRYAALDGRGGSTIALAALSEQPVAGLPALGLKVSDVAGTAAALRAAGAPVGEVTEGGHERRAVLRDPDGNVLVVYGPS
ncbi:catechol 2,3-dioxygenase-like lactoylglutathione lyase family enzyme [Actinocorallia herbida]|uniref:Catechol 2,3-dioxygenase-like lactoylglutathione lyase family enzyme n=1 Tax=Actinocorallia herbida TaxID=58109 RepID=A0A3N1CWZ1_9ACTN|nr:VOC family protein [Actinocorallia herbida]ROO85819.1 catechol 2,3-dioxygenase-like lactoylglutathione lyase family enzyme [Actinocorallia herbida]